MYCRHLKISRYLAIMLKLYFKDELMPTIKETSNQDKKLLIRLPGELHAELRLIAFKLNISMAEMCTF
jgi:predicted HicB family RNase H-like nuclease